MMKPPNQYAEEVKQACSEVLRMLADQIENGKTECELLTLFAPDDEPNTVLSATYRLVIVTLFRDIAIGTKFGEQDI